LLASEERIAVSGHIRDGHGVRGEMPITAQQHLGRSVLQAALACNIAAIGPAWDEARTSRLLRGYRIDTRGC